MQNATYGWRFLSNRALEDVGQISYTIASFTFLSKAIVFVDMSGEPGSLVKTLKELPLWFQIAGTALPIFLAAWGIYLVYHPPIPQDVFARAVNATSTIPLGDILSRADDFRTGYEQSNFLKTYVGKYVSGQGSYSNFFGFGDNSYYVIVDVRVGWLSRWIYPYEVACTLKDSGQDEKDTLMLLKKGQTIYFVGTFSNSSLNGYYYPTISDCTLLKVPA